MSIIVKIKDRLENYIYLFNEYFLNKKIYFKTNKNHKISLRNFNKICKFRTKTIYSKEPETISWINKFNKKDTLIDIGANIGIYSLYAGNRIKNVFAFEPDALNYALLNLNISDNKLQKKIKAYPIAIYSKNSFNTLNIQEYLWGGALSLFNSKNFTILKKNKVSFNQGAVSMSIDHVIQGIKININTHCKIDVDGNEFEILKGAKNCLKRRLFKSILIELDVKSKNYNKILNIFKNNNYALLSKNSSPLFSGVYDQFQNHIFFRR